MGVDTLTARNSDTSVRISHETATRLRVWRAKLAALTNDVPTLDQVINAGLDALDTPAVPHSHSHSPQKQAAQHA